MRSWICFLLIFISSYLFSSDLIVDSCLTLKKALANNNFPEKVKKDLCLVNVQYFSFDGRLHQGQLVINKEVKEEVLEIFEVIKKKRFPISKVIPIISYDWSDSASMADNNTSAFNYRVVSRTKTLSNHSWGLAIDINPFLNPWIKGQKIMPVGASYNRKVPGTIVGTSFVVKEFESRGWIWGGRWKSTKDYQHFEKEKDKKK